MYTLQSWWTQARESLDVTTVILENRSYAIFELELSRVGGEAAGPVAKAMLELEPPPLDFVSLAAAWECRPSVPPAPRSSLLCSRGASPNPDRL